MNKSDKRNHIGEFLDIANNRFKKDELEELNDYVNDPNNVGKSYTKRYSFDDWSSDGKYTREETTTYTIQEDKTIQKDYSYHDDDGQTGGYSENVKGGREILNLLSLFKK